MEESQTKNGVVACQYDDPFANVKLVDRETCPNGYQLVDPKKSGKTNQFDLVELASQIQTADQVTPSMINLFCVRPNVLN
jgi:hypothetical protein